MAVITTRASGFVCATVENAPVNERVAIGFADCDKVDTTDSQKKTAETYVGIAELGLDDSGGSLARVARLNEARGLTASALHWCRFQAGSTTELSVPSETIEHIDPDIQHGLVVVSLETWRRHGGQRPPRLGGISGNSLADGACGKRKGDDRDASEWAA